MGLSYGGPGVTPSLEGLPGTTLNLQAGQTFIIPSGVFQLGLGPYTAFQEADPITGIWRTVGTGMAGGGMGGAAGPLWNVHSDGVNWRLANQSGCAVGAVVTTAGSGYTTPPTVVASAGGSKWSAIVGGAISATVTVTNGGTGYNYPPLVVFSLPPALGLPASGYCTLSGTAVSTVTVTDRGAGYNAPPTISFIIDPRENGINGLTPGSGAAAVASLTGAGTITGLVCVDHGNPVTAVPTFTFGSGAAVATCAMMWAITAYAVSATTAGSGYTTPVIISAYATPISGSVIVNPTMQNALVKKRNAFIVGALSAGALTATGQTVIDGGVYDQVPTVFVMSSNVSGAGPVAGVFLSPSMGGVNDVSVIFPG